MPGERTVVVKCASSPRKWREKRPKRFFFIWEKQGQLTRSRSHASIPEPSTCLNMSSKPIRGLGKHVTLSDTPLLVPFIPICAPLWQSVGRPGTLRAVPRDLKISPSDFSCHSLWDDHSYIPPPFRSYHLRFLSRQSTPTSKYRCPLSSSGSSSLWSSFLPSSSFYSSSFPIPSQLDGRCGFSCSWACLPINFCPTSFR